MKKFVPDYYNDFACIKGACRHSCCVGWEIDIDEDSLNSFLGVPGELGRRLRESILQNEEGASFQLTEEERCPFLNCDGLCDLILELGEDCLCQICDDHPRFRNFIAGREEIGLGLCCEAACRLILGRKEPVQFIELEDDGLEEEFPEDDAWLLQLRGQLISMAQDRRITVEGRIRRMLDFLRLDLKSFEPTGWIDFLLELERLDESWAERLGGMQKPDKFPEWELAFEQLLVYLLMRHLPGALEDDDIAGHIAYVVFAWELVRAICAAQENLDLDGLVEICRLYSSELEYSDENIDCIIDRLHELNPGI